MNTFKNTFKRLAFTLLAACAIAVTAPYATAGIDNVAETLSLLKSEYQENLSPFYGSLAWETDWIMRFNDFCAAKDIGKDSALAQIVQTLFYREPNTHIRNYFHLTKCITNLSTKKRIEIAQTIAQTLWSLCSGKSSALILNVDKTANQGNPQIVIDAETIQKALIETGFNTAQSVATSASTKKLFAKNTLFKILLSVIWILGKEDPKKEVLYAYYLALHQASGGIPFQAPPILQKTFTSTTTISELEPLTDDLLERTLFVAFSPGEFPTEPHYTQPTININKDVSVKFSDCYETTCRYIMDILRYKAKTKHFETKCLLDRCPEMKLHPDVVLFFEKHNDPLRTGELDAHNDWAALVANIPGIDYLKTQKNTGYRYELNPTLKNFTILMNYLLGLNLFPAAELDRPDFVATYFPKLCKTLNIKYSWDIKQDETIDSRDGKDGVETTTKLTFTDELPESHILLTRPKYHGACSLQCPASAHTTALSLLEKLEQTHPLKYVYAWLRPAEFRELFSSNKHDLKFEVAPFEAAFYCRLENPDVVADLVQFCLNKFKANTCPILSHLLDMAISQTPDDNLRIILQNVMALIRAFETNGVDGIFKLIEQEPNLNNQLTLCSLSLVKTKEMNLIEDTKLERLCLLCSGLFDVGINANNDSHRKSAELLEALLYFSKDCSNEKLKISILRNILTSIEKLLQTRKKTLDHHTYTENDIPAIEKEAYTSVFATGLFFQIAAANAIPSCPSLELKTQFYKIVSILLDELDVDFPGEAEPDTTNPPDLSWLIRTIETLETIQDKALQQKIFNSSVSIACKALKSVGLKDQGVDLLLSLLLETSCADLATKNHLFSLVFDSLIASIKNPTDTSGIIIGPLSRIINTPSVAPELQKQLCEKIVQAMQETAQLTKHSKLLSDSLDLIPKLCTNPTIIELAISLAKKHLYSTNYELKKSSLKLARTLLERGIELDEISKIIDSGLQSNNDEVKTAAQSLQETAINHGLNLEAELDADTEYEYTKRMFDRINEQPDI